MIKFRLISNCPSPSVLRVAMDSGAFSWSKSQARLSGGDRSDFTFSTSEDFRRYLREYIYYLQANKHKFDFYVNLDVIGNHKSTLETQKEMENNGLDPVPVFHAGSPFEVFKRYADKYPIVGVSDSAQKEYTGKRSTISCFNELFKYICDKRGKPSVKVHGFAMTRMEYMRMYPWWSVDSSSWATQARYGGIIIPRSFPAPAGRFDPDWLASPKIVKVTKESINDKSNLHRGGEYYKKIVELYIRQYFGDDYFRTLDEYITRDVINAVLFTNAGKSLQQHCMDKFCFDGGNIYLGAKTSSATGKGRTLKFLEEVRALETGGPSAFKFFGSFFYLKDTETFISESKLITTGT